MQTAAVQTGAVQTSAEQTAPAKTAAALPPIVNAMTVDVEDYFHVSVFDGVVPRHAWDGLESRVCANTERLLGIFDETGVRATFFVLGWVAERFPALVQAIAAIEAAPEGLDVFPLQSYVKTGGKKLAKAS